MSRLTRAKLQLPRLYFAAPLFNDAERTFNSHLARDLSPYFEVFLPQRDGALITQLLASGMAVEQAKRVIFERDLDAISHCEVLLAVLDGRAVDEGVAVELGIGFAYGKRCWGLKTDFRSLAPFGDNPMVEVIISNWFSSRTELVEFAQSYRSREVDAR